VTNTAHQPIAFCRRDDIRRLDGTPAHEIDPVKPSTFGGEQAGVVARHSREIVLAADIRASDRLVDDLVAKIEAALEGRLSDDDLSSIIERLQDTDDLTPDQVLRLRIPMMKFEGLLLGVRAMRGVHPAPRPA
jgi:hypothetical protein